MMRFHCFQIGLMSLVLSSGALQAAAGCGGHGDPATMLVSTNWLAEHLKDPDLVLIGVGTAESYGKGHIPGAVLLTLAEVSAKGVPLTLELPPMGDLAETFRGKGVSDQSRIVIYTMESSIQSTTRVYLTLDAMGLARNTSLLNGGFNLWKAEGREVTTAVPAVRRGNVQPCEQHDIVVEAGYVRSSVHHAGIGIVDARLPAFYSGEQIPNGQRAGHIPGAANVPFNSLVDEQGKLKSKEAITALFTAAGIKSGDQVVSYCHIGQQATVVYFAARYLGYDARLYDGSWQDWSAHQEFPVETTLPH